LNQAREELWEELDREPTEEEVADRTGISVKKQLKIRRDRLLHQHRDRKSESCDSVLDVEPRRSRDDDGIDSRQGEPGLEISDECAATFVGERILQFL
jgi:DNA-directed RNA polymerase specialized sigma subunit